MLRDFYSVKKKMKELTAGLKDNHSLPDYVSYPVIGALLLVIFILM